MLKNGYIDTSVQKGFIERVAGCIEHSETVFQAIVDARTHKRNICVSWIDLANAYGSVRHSMILFTLEWYHVPEEFAKIIFMYYEGLAASVMVGKEQTKWFRFQIGVFQGCTLSTMLFDTAFNTIFDCVLDMEEECGHKFTEVTIEDDWSRTEKQYQKAAPLTKTEKEAIDKKKKTLKMEKIVTGYADDVAAITEWPFQNQEAINAMQEWLVWTETMKAKPQKCLATAMEGGQGKDPLLTIAGAPMKWIANKPFKFLGKQICTDGSDKAARKLLMQKFEENVTKIDEAPLTGSKKNVDI